MFIAYEDKTQGKTKILETKGFTVIHYLEIDKREKSEIAKGGFSKHDKFALPYGKKLLEELTEELPIPE